MHRVRRVVRTVLVAVATLALPAAPALAGGLDIRLGAFFPRAESSLFFDDSELYTVDQDDWRGFQGGAEYAFNLADQVELGVHLDGYGRTVHTQYRDFEFESGRAITQSLKLSTAPFGVTLRFVPRPGQLTPYIGGGVDLVVYEYEEFGEFVDFEADDFPVFDDAFISRGTAFGAHVAGGLRVPLNEDFSITGEARYLWAEDDMGDDFRGSRIDLGGLTATIGLHVQF